MSHATERLYERLLLRPADVPSTRDDFEVVGVFNPGAVRIDGEVILLVRVAERPREKRPGYTGLPRWENHGELTVDWVPDDQLEPIDPRVVRRKADGLVRLTFTSHLRVVRCGDGRSVEEVTETKFVPGSELEEFGVEDPRITPLYGRFYFTYVAVSRHGAATALGSTADFKEFTRQGVIFCSENKDVVLFPEWVAGAHVALHRPNPATPFCRPEMWVAWSQDIIHWGHHGVLHGGGAEWETGRVGAGTPPVRVPGGWLEIYHGSRHTTTPGRGRQVLDGRTPPGPGEPRPDPPPHPGIDLRADRRIRAPRLRPRRRLPDRDRRDRRHFLVYYGAADTCTAVVEFSKEELMGTLVPV